MSVTSQVVMGTSLELLTKVVDAESKPAAIQVARASLGDLSPELMARVAGYLAVELVWGVRPRRSRAAIREWISSEWVRVMQSPVMRPDRVVVRGALEGGSDSDVS